MQELKFGNFLSSLFTFIIAITISIGFSYINIPPFGLPVPLLMMGILAIFLLLGFISYPKATMTQVIQLAITGVFLNAIVFVAVIAGVKYLNSAPVSLDLRFFILINPLITVSSFLFSYLTLITFVKFENKAVVPKKRIKQKEKVFIIDSPPEEIKISVPAKEIVDENSVSSYEELYQQAKIQIQAQKTEESPDKEFLLQLSEKNIAEEKLEEFIELESFSFDKTRICSGLPERQHGASDLSLQLEEKNQTSTSGQNDDNEYFDCMPTDIRLVEAYTSKNNEAKGRIASIGKLLVNNRDIENVIESGVALAESGLESKTNIFSSVSGEQIYEKFNKIQQEFAQIKEIALIDKGGFILASNYEDKMKIHITGALIAGAYHTLQNYLAQISFKNPQKIFFETENSNNFIMKTNNELLFSICDKEFKHIDYSALEGFIENEMISEADLTPLIELNQIKKYAISDGTGKLVKSIDNTENSEKLAIISAALFENLKVFLMNIQLMKLKRLTILNSEEVITIQKFNDEISSFITPVDGIIKLSEDFQKMEELY